MKLTEANLAFVCAADPNIGKNGRPKVSGWVIRVLSGSRSTILIGRPLLLGVVASNP